MARTSAWRSAALGAAAVLAAAALACRENVTAPGQCPELCPSDSVSVIDTVLTGIVASDTSARGYTRADRGPILVVASRTSLEAHPVIRFQSLPQRWFPVVGDTAGVAVGTIDSVALELRLDDRDTSVHNNRLLVYRLPATVDTTGAFDSVRTFFTDSLPFDSIPIDDSLRTGVRLRRLLPIASVTPQAADSFVVALGLAIRGDSGAVALLAAADFSGAPPILRYYVHGAAPQDTFATALALAPTFDTYVQSPAPPAPAPGQLVIGGQPAARSFLRFAIPRYYVDSVTIIRGTLTLTQTQAASGLPGDTFAIQAQPVLRDFGGKSLIFQDTSVIGRGRLVVGQSGTVSLEVGNILRLWHGINADSLPRMIVLRGSLEDYTLSELVAAGAGGGAAAPQLRISFVRSFRFGVP